jgi:hypothetical protein
MKHELYNTGQFFVFFPGANYFMQVVDVIQEDDMNLWNSIFIPTVTHVKINSSRPLPRIPRFAMITQLMTADTGIFPANPEVQSSGLQAACRT